MSNILGGNVLSRLAVFFWGAVVSIFSLGADNSHEVYLTQGWDAATREQVSFTSFGSRYLPYSWFLALEQADKDELFRTNSYLSRLGFIGTSASSYNPDGLPIGLTKDTNDQGDTWVGFTCAACHTGQIRVGGKSIRIDGGQALINFSEFEQSSLAALKSTLSDPIKYNRFFQRVKASTENQLITETELAAAIAVRIKELDTRFQVNATAVPYGHGRLDAFGQIFNAIAVEALGMPENRHAPNAPTSFPVLWDASHLDLVQWNASAPNKEPGPLFQNAITALAVYGAITVPKNKTTYDSSTQISNLGYLQKQFYQLNSPQWPELLAGELNPKKAALGAGLYQKHCLQCHSLVDSSDKKRKLRAVLTPVNEVGTDPLMANNFNQLRVNSGILEGQKTMIFFGEKLPPETSPMDLVVHVALGSLIAQPWQTIKALLKEYQTNYSAPKQEANYHYKARPINGIWASAPYLHNGSVPTIYDLLLPPSQRPKTFYVGNRELDTQKVGNLSTPSEYSSLFDTALVGNSNLGHEFGVSLNEDERWALVEYIKSL